MRAIALAVVAVKGETLDQKLTLDLVKRFDVRAAFSPDELAFIDNPTPSERDRVQFAWRYEALGVMLWALGFEQELARPDKIVDVPRAVGILRDLGRDGFVAKAKLRSIDQILDQADLIYRYHWAVMDARVIWRHIRTLLSEAGLGITNLVSLRTYLADPKFDEPNARIRAEQLGSHRVASTVVCCTLLEPKWKLEVEAVAAG